MEFAALLFFGVEETLMRFGAHLGGLSRILKGSQPTRGADWDVGQGSRGGVGLTVYDVWLHQREIQRRPGGGASDIKPKEGGRGRDHGSLGQADRRMMDGQAWTAGAKKKKLE